MVTTSIARPVDAFTRWLFGVYMPWLGKSFDPESSTGINVLQSQARSQIRMLARGYEPKMSSDGSLEAFAFRTRIAPGALDPGVDVLKIDYDIDENPSVVRRLLDELVQVDEDLFLGKILYRLRSSWQHVGFFSLRAEAPT